MYEARGVPDEPDDGTLAPGAVAASLPFAPELVTDTLRELVRAHPKLRSEYGLRASLNPTFGDWVSPLNYGLDQGPIVMMIENYRTGLLWNLMRRCPYIWRGLRQAGLAHRLPLTLGWELAGTVEKVGADVGRFQPGDEVFGMIDLSGDGADAEFVVADEKALAIKPQTLDFPSAAAVPIGALTGYQALFD